jgi:hypothetical protein
MPSRPSLTTSMPWWRAALDPKSTWLLMALACFGVLTVSASAEDANSTPPHLQLKSAGQDGVVGPQAAALAFFSTPVEPASARYGAHSKLTFRCLIDRRPTRCSDEFLPVIVSEPAVALGRAAPQLGEELPGTYEGSVPLPEGLPSGPHTVTVIGTDEDGTAASPPTVGVYLDRTPPRPPKLLRAPPRASRRDGPRFRVVSEDAHGFPGARAAQEPFEARLRRLQPAGRTLVTPPRYVAGGPGSYIERLAARCGPRRCSQVLYPSHIKIEGKLGVAVQERLRPGLYEFVVWALDAARNRSAATAYRFRIQPDATR